MNNFSKLFVVIIAMITPPLAAAAVDNSAAPVSRSQPAASNIITQVSSGPTPTVGKNDATNLSAPAMMGKGADATSNLKTVSNGLPPSDGMLRKGSDFDPPEFYRSVMFRQDDINKVRMVHKVYLDRLKNKQSPIRPNDYATLGDTKMEDLLNKLNSSNPQQVELPSAPIGIYLNSILFRGAGNAIAWINGKKYEIGIASDNIKLINVTSTSAELAWHLGNYKDTDINDWAIIFPDLGKTDNDKLPPSRHGIKVDAQNRTIDFILRPNQYLDVQNKAIREGRPKPAVVPTAVNTNTPGIPNPNINPNPSSDPNKAAHDLAQMENEAKSDLGATLKTQDNISAPAGQNPTTAQPEKTSTVYKAAADGHFNIVGKANGQDINFRVDSGATFPVISKDDAKRIGLDVDKLQYNYEAKIANGEIIKSARTTIPEIEFDGVKFKNIDAMVGEGPVPQALLGSSFTNQYTVIDHGIMTLSSNSGSANAPIDATPNNGSAAPATATTPASAPGPTPISSAPAPTSTSSAPQLKSIKDLQNQNSNQNN